MSKPKILSARPIFPFLVDYEMPDGTRAKAIAYLEGITRRVSLAPGYEDQGGLLTAIAEQIGKQVEDAHDVGMPMDEVYEALERAKEIQYNQGVGKNVYGV